MRKIVSFTILNNEADIIESFVRYNMSYLDKMVIIDNGCTDKTIDILKLLKGEGLDIDIYDESLVDFEQYQVMNKYLRLIVDKYEPDVIIPLDADEFLMSDERSVRDILEEIPLDCVHFMQWRTFVHTENDGSTGFVCVDMKNSYLHKDGKVIVPAALVRSCSLVLAVGQHRATGNMGLKTRPCKNLNVAHYPNRSIEQVRAKSLCHSIRYVNYLNRRNGESVHRNMLARQVIDNYGDSDGWLKDFVMRRMDEHHFNATGVECHPINLSLQFREIPRMRYREMAQVSTFLNLYQLAKIMAIKAYNFQIERNFAKGAEIVLIYGTGEKAKALFDGFPTDLFNVRAYINSNPECELTMFEHRLVITPELLKFFRYDKIIISSSLYHDEMQASLLEQGVPEDKIVDAGAVLEESIRRLS